MSLQIQTLWQHLQASVPFFPYICYCTEPTLEFHCYTEYHWTGLKWSPQLKTKMHHKRQITLFQIVSHHQEQLHQPIFKTHQLTVSSLHPYIGYSPTKAKGKRGNDLLFVLHPTYPGHIYRSHCSWFSFILKVLWSSLYCLQNAWTLHLLIWSLKWYLGFGINTVATSEPSLRKSHILLILNTSLPKA